MEQLFQFSKLQKQNGQSLVEMILAVGLLAIAIPAIITTFIVSRQGRPQQDVRVQALATLEQQEEAIRNIREAGWTNISTDGTYYAVPSGTQWTLTTTSAPHVIDSASGLAEEITIGDVYRDNNDKIVPQGSGSTLDPSTKQVTITVSWNQPYASSFSVTSYLTRYLDNLTWVQTSVADFQAGNLQGTTVTNNSGGEVELAAGSGDWCKPQDYILSTYTLPRQANAIQSTAGSAIGDPSSAYVGMGNGTSGLTYQTLSISDPQNGGNPVVSPVGSGYSSSYKTNAVANDGTYTYLAASGSTNQVVILDSNYNVVSTITLSTGQDANGISVSSGILYVTSGSQVFSYNVSNPSSPALLGTATVWLGKAMQAYYSSGRLFVSIANSLTGLEIFTVTNGGKNFTPWSITSLGIAQIPSGLAVNSTGTRAYISFANSTFSQGGFEIIDTDPNDRIFIFVAYYSPLVSTYNTNVNGQGFTNPLGMAVATADKVLIVGTGGEYQYQVVDITNEKTPTFCGGLSINQGVSAVSTVIQQDGRVFAYAISGESNNQFKVIEGGSGGEYVTSGTFTSSPFNPGYKTSVNYFTSTIAQPSKTSIQMQIGGANPSPPTTCANATYTFVGPDGTSGTYFTPNGNSISGTVPFGTYSNGYQNPATCFEYKVYMSTADTSQTPVLDDTTFNYSP